MLERVNFSGKAITFQARKGYLIDKKVITKQQYVEIHLNELITRKGYFLGIGCDADETGSETYSIVVDSLTGQSLEVGNTAVKFRMEEKEK